MQRALRENFLNALATRPEPAWWLGSYMVLPVCVSDGLAASARE